MNFLPLPENLPVPVDDGAAAHLEGLHLLGPPEHRWLDGCLE